MNAPAKPVAVQPVAAPTVALSSGPVIRAERSGDAVARERLLDAAMGVDRRSKTSERLREGNSAAIALIAEGQDGTVSGSVRLWPVVAGSAGEGLLLGPLAVDPAAQGSGIGKALMQAAIEQARAAGHRFILLVGDAPYYARFGFSPALTLGLDLPGPVERARFLALELVEGALGEATGRITRPPLRRRHRPVASVVKQGRRAA